MLKNKCTSFYKVDKKGVKSYYDFKKKGYVKLDENPKIILLPGLKERKKTIKENPSASLVDIGDGVACLEFHTKMNSIDPDMMKMISEGCDIVNKDFTGLVVANHDQRMFSAGDNLFLVLVAIQEGKWDELKTMVRELQIVNMKMKYLPKPVVIAPAGMALAGGCEIAMHGDYCLANGETYMGLVEVGVGVIPAGGGCKELAIRATEGIPAGVVESGLNMPIISARFLKRSPPPRLHQRSDAQIWAISANQYDHMSRDSRFTKPNDCAGHSSSTTAEARFIPVRENLRVGRCDSQQHEGRKIRFRI
jgi:3-hydroxyacyl-CoA dehydrogenase